MDVLTSYLGCFGRWQLFIFLVVSIFQLPLAIQTFALTFFAPNIDFWCARPKGFNLDVATWKEYISPRQIGKDISDNCNKYAGVYEFAEQLALIRSRSSSDDTINRDNVEEIFKNWTKTINGTLTTTEECTAWEYDTSVFKNSMTEQFNLVCKNSILISTSNSIAMLGYLFGAFIYGHISDRFGRKKTAMYSMIMSTLLNLGIVACHTFMPFMILRFFQSFLNSGVLHPTLVLFAEVCSEKYRATMGNLIWLGYGTGIALFSAVAYGLREWKFMQLTSSIPYIFILVLIWILPESPRWLLSKNRITEAVYEIRRAARWNRIDAPQDNVLMRQFKELHLDKYHQEDADTKKYSILDLFRFSQLRWKTLNIYFCFGVNAFLYFGLTFSTNEMVGDPFVNMALSGLIQIPSSFLAAFVAHYIGRKYPTAVGMIIAGAACSASIFIPAHMTILRILFPTLGKLFITASYCLIIVFAAEIFPTVVRNIAMGSCYTVAAISAVLAPYVKELGIYTHEYVPPAAYGILALVSGLTILLLPETKNKTIPDTLEEALAAFRKKTKSEKRAEQELQLEEFI